MTPSIERIRHSGMLVVSAVVRGSLVTRRYMGYTKREAIRRFKEECRANDMEHTA